VASGQLLRRWQGHRGLVRSLAFSPNGTLLASGGSDWLIHLWDPATGQEVTGSLKHVQSVTSLVFAADGKVLASGSADGRIHLWEVMTGKERYQSEAFQLGEWGCVSVAFSPDGRRLASGTAGRVIRLWDRATGAEVHQLRGHGGWIWSLAFSPDGARLASASDDTTVLCWDVAGPLKDPSRHAAPLPAGDLQELWAHLGEGDASLAFGAMGVLARLPRQAVPFLQEHLLAALPAEEERSSRGGADVSGLALSAEHLRQLRALEVLEQLATADARQALELLAESAPASRLRAEARAALGRLAVRH
jgi:hypothetical protein